MATKNEDYSLLSSDNLSMLITQLKEENYDKLASEGRGSNLLHSWALPVIARPTAAVTDSVAGTPTGSAMSAAAFRISPLSSRMLL